MGGAMRVRLNEPFLPPWLDRIVALHPCPYCDARAGMQCRTKKGGTRKCRPHTARIAAETRYVWSGCADERADLQEVK